MEGSIKPFQLQNAVGDKAIVLNFGARLHQWQPKLHGGNRDMLVSYDNIEQHLQDPNYMGAIAGPYANRLAGAKIHMDGNDVALEANEGSNHLHGGNVALHNVFWQVESQASDTVTLVYEYSAKAEPKLSYPGNIRFLATYSLSGQGELLIQLEAYSDRKTCVGPTGHAYFNLSGSASKIDDHQLQVNGQHYTPVNSDNIPTGELARVEGDFDYLTARPMTASVDHNFVLDAASAPVAAIVRSPEQDVEMIVSTDYPGLQFYTADGLGAPFIGRQGFCLEPQFFPNAPNQEGFSFTWTTPETPFKRFIQYKAVAI